ncbi:MAG: hypothetical protein Q8O84_05640 [Nanoarchaeota archaeon]|nr:hypothetical protein [Nanoarchaeota archaeon]
MTEQTNEKTLEERTKSRMKKIEAMIENAGDFYGRSHHHHDPTKRAIYTQNLAIHKQNEIIIDYLQEIYKTQKGEKK